MRIVFAGSPAAAVPSLRALAPLHDIAAVLTRAASRQGRRRELSPTDVGAAAAELGLPVIEANRLDAQVGERVAALEADLGVIVAYGGLVREPLLSAPKHGWINVHFSRLPEYRGAAPVQHALIDGRTATGVSIFRLVPELDAGPVLSMTDVPIAASETAGALLDRLATIGAVALVDAARAIEDGSARFVEQAGSASFAPKLTAEDAALNFQDSADTVLNHWRGTTPEPGAHVRLSSGARVKVVELAAADAVTPAGSITLDQGRAIAGTASTALELVRVQPAGKRAMPGADWLRGRPGETHLLTGPAAIATSEADA